MQARIVVPPRLFPACRLTRTKAGVAGLQMPVVRRKERMDEPRGAQAETRDHTLKIRAVAPLSRSAAQGSLLAFEIKAFAAGFEPTWRQKATLAAIQIERQLRQIEDASRLQNLGEVGGLGRFDRRVPLRVRKRLHRIHGEAHRRMDSMSSMSSAQSGRTFERFWKGCLTGKELKFGKGSARHRSTASVFGAGCGCHPAAHASQRPKRMASQKGGV